MKQPLPHQKFAIEKAIAHYSSNDRGQLIMACGAGKTLTSLWIAEELSCQKILVMLPNLVLMRQTVFEWLRNTSINNLKYLLVCGDPSVAQDSEDTPIQNLSDIEIPVTTEHDEIRDFVHINLDKPFVIFSTYQSSEVLAKAIANFDQFKFDIIICDEAHRTTGALEKLFSGVLLDAFIPAKKRLFMTATPKVLSKHVMNEDVEEDVQLFSMSDEKFYGKEFFRFSYGEAIRAGILVDYKIIISIVTNDDIRKVLKENPKIKLLKNGTVQHSRELAKEIAFLKAVSQHSIKHCISFHSKIQKAQRFCDGVFATGKAMKESSILDHKISSFHVNGQMSAASRLETIELFINSAPSLITNARCLAEGVDIPAVDGIFFHNPKSGVSDIVQATGRALRRADSKDTAYLIVPVFMPQEAEGELYLESSDFQHVWQVIRAMQAHDERLEDTISRLRIHEGFEDSGVNHDEEERSVYVRKLFARVKVEGKPQDIDFNQFSQSIETKLLREVGSSWDRYFGILQAFRSQNPDRWPKQDEKFNEWSIGYWCQLQKRYHRTDLLEERKYQMLVGIGFEFNSQFALWEERFELLKEYRALHPDRWPTVNDKFNEFGLGAWCNKQMAAYKAGTLDPIRYKQLLEIDFPFAKGLSVDVWEKNFELLKKFRKENPNRWPAYDAIYEGVRLGPWCQVHRTYLRKKTLSKKRYEKLRSIGFIFDPHDRNWEKGFKALLEFRKKYPSEWPHKNSMFHKFKLGTWCSNKRNLINSNKINPEHKKQLMEIGFPLSIGNPAALKWYKNFQMVVEFRKVHPNRWPRKRETFKGYRVGEWCGDQRWYYKMNKMKKDKVEALQSIGFRLMPGERTKNDKVLVPKKTLKKRLKKVNDFNWQELRRLRIERKMTLEQVATLTKIRASYVSNFERGVIMPNVKQAKILNRFMSSPQSLVPKPMSPERQERVAIGDRYKKRDRH